MAALNLWDPAFAKYRPQVACDVNRKLGRGTNRTLLKVEGPAKTGVWVRSMRAYPPLITIAKDSSLDGIVRAARALA